MSSTPVAEPHPQASGRASGRAFFGWAVLVVASYVVVRSDTRPLVLALLARVLDVAVPLLAVGAFVPAARSVLAKLTPSLSPVDRILLLGPVALGLLMFLTTVLGIAHALNTAALTSALAMVAVLGLRGWPAVASDWRSALRQVWPAASPGLERWPGLPHSVIAGIALLMTCTPAISQDALHYHLAVPRAWLAAGYFCDVPGNVYARFPMNAETLFALGLALRGEIAAKVFHWLCFVFASLAVWRLAARFASPRTAGWAALAFMSIPTAFRVATWAYVEHTGLLFMLLAWLVLATGAGRALGGVALAGWLAGLACGTKYTFVPPAMLLCVWAVARAAPAWWKCLAVGVVGGVLGGGAWYIRNLVDLGNPVFPFMYDWFGGPGWDAARAQLFAQSLSEWGTLGWDLPIALTYRATFALIAGFDGIVGPVFLTGLPIVILALVRAPACRATGVFALLLALAWLAFTCQIRFLLPALAVVATLIPAGIELLSAQSRMYAKGALGAAVGVSLLSPLLLFVRLDPLPYLIGLESTDAFCQRNFAGGDYAVFRGLDRWVPENGRVLLAGGGSPIYLCSRPVYADSVVENHSLRAALASGKTPEGVAGSLRESGFTHLLFRFPLVFGASSDLSAAEQDLLMRFLNSYAQRVVAVGETLLYALDGEGNQ